MARAWKETVMNRIQRCLSALTAFAGALLAVFIMPAGPSVAVDRSMPNVGMPSGDCLGYRCRGWPACSGGVGVIAMRRAGAIVAAAAAATLTMLAAACGSTGSTSASSAPSPTVSHQASGRAQSQQASTAVCRDGTALQAPLTGLASASGAKGALTQVKANLKDAQAKLSALTDDAHGAFSTQIHAMKSALTTLQAAVNGGPGARVSTALDGVTQAESVLVGVLAQGGCGAHEG